MKILPLEQPKVKFDCWSVKLCSGRIVEVDEEPLHPRNNLICSSQGWV